MKEFIAKGSRQVDLCMRMLYHHNVRFSVVPCKDDKERVYYKVKVNVSQKRFDELLELYKTLIK